jgi:hypothetical protein
LGATVPASVKHLERQMNGPLSVGSAGPCHIPVTNKQGTTDMTILARRFILICLVAAIFAMLLAAAVAQSDRGDWVSASRFCTPADGSNCLLVRQ